MQNGPGPHKLKSDYKPPRRPMDPAPLHNFNDVAGMLWIKGQTQLRTERGASFWARAETNGTGQTCIALPWQKFIYAHDWGYNRASSDNNLIQNYIRALDDWACIYLGRPPEPSSTVTKTGPPEP